ncbi:Uma2 family endonuclease [Streptomyces sp. NPDC019890]|uniref:Uma2 family endonuclease n=1 Tax=Streptomyces sp. NPDC019890 TaxID=3365064 RepID=UPI00384F37AC
MASTGRTEQATEDNWMFPPAEGWTVDQVNDLELPFDWDLVDGVIVARGETTMVHDVVRGNVCDALRAAAPDGFRAEVERCVQLNETTAIKPDVVVYDKRGLELFTVRCTPAGKVTLVVEVMSPGSKGQDRISKPAQFAEAKVPCFWRIELERDRKLAVHEYWLNPDTRSYFPAPMHPVHRDKLSTELPFSVELDLAALLEP